MNPGISIIIQISGNIINIPIIDISLQQLRHDLYSFYSLKKDKILDPTRQPKIRELTKHVPNPKNKKKPSKNNNTKGNSRLFKIIAIIRRNPYR